MRVLIVDDSPVERLILRSACEREGHACVEAVNGEDAWDLLRDQDVDVVIVDWMMPMVSGPELCARIRARRDAPYIYIVVCTILADREHEHASILSGADAFLTKPLDVDALDMCLISAARILSMQRELAETRAELARLKRALAERMQSSATDCEPDSADSDCTLRLRC